LLADAAHLARASGVALALDLSAVPRVDGVTVDEAASSGEEYELLLTVPPEAALDFHEFERAFHVPLTDIGRVAEAGADLVGIDGGDPERSHGHDHLDRTR
jgi:thiamine-monophosphate kinase